MKKTASRVYQWAFILIMVLQAIFFHRLPFLWSSDIDSYAYIFYIFSFLFVSPVLFASNFAFWRLLSSIDGVFKFILLFFTFFCIWLLLIFPFIGKTVPYFYTIFLGKSAYREGAVTELYEKAYTSTRGLRSCSYTLKISNQNWVTRDVCIDADMAAVFKTALSDKENFQCVIYIEGVESVLGIIPRKIGLAREEGRPVCFAPAKEEPSG